MSELEDNAIQTVRLSDRAKQKLIERIEKQAATTPPPSERRNIRAQYQNPNLRVIITQPSGQTIKHVVVARNLSRWGMAFIHGRFVYQDSRCIAILPSLDGKERQVEGKVIRCRHVGGIMHEVSVLFEQPIDLDLYISLLPKQQKHCDEKKSDTPDQNKVQDTTHAPTEDDTEPVFSVHADVTTMRPLIEDFVTGLGEHINKLNQANKVEDFEQLLAICSQLNNVGANYGFDQITQISRLVVEHLSDHERDVHAIGKTVEDLLGIMRRVRFE